MRIACSALVGALALVTAAKAEPPPLSVYAEKPAIRDVGLSPDGKNASFLRTTGDTQTLFVLPLSGGPRQIMLGATEVKGADWIDPDHILIIHSAMVEVPDLLPRQDVSQGLSYNLRTQHKATILNDTAGTVPMLAGATLNYGTFNGVPTVYLRGLGVGIRFNLYRANAETGRGEILDPGSLNSLQWVVAHDGRMLAKSEYEPNSRTWLLFVRRAAAWKLLKKEQTDRPPALLGLGKTEDSIVLGRDDSDLEMSVESGIESSLAPPGSSVRSELHNHGTGRLVGVQLTGDTPTYAFFDPALKSSWDEAVASFPGKRVMLADFSNDYRQIIVHVEGPGEPGAYYWVHLDQRQAEEVESEYPTLKPDQVGPVNKVDYAAQDGLQLGGYLTLPPGREAKALPLVVLVHGGPNSRDALTFDPEAQALASRGYAVLQVNFRGSSDVAQGLQEAGYGEWGRKMQTDLSDGVNYLASKGVIDPKRVCIMGVGYGGYAALAGVTLQNGIYRCAVAIDPITNVPAAIRNPDRDDRGLRGPIWDRVYLWRRYVGTNASAVSPLSAAGRADAPILLIHGSDEQVIPITQSTYFYDALKRAKKPVEFVTLKGDHDLSTAAARLQMLEAAVRFLHENNPAS